MKWIREKWFSLGTAFVLTLVVCVAASLVYGQAATKPATAAKPAAAQPAAQPVAQPAAVAAPEAAKPAVVSDAQEAAHESHAGYYKGKPAWLIWVLWVLAPLGAVAALYFARRFYQDMMNSDPGTERMQEIAGYVRQGAMAYLRQQYKVVAVVFICAAVVLAVLAFVMKVQHGLVPFAFLTGGFFSRLAGFIGMKTATNASARTAAGARESLDKGLRVAFRSGAVMGLVVVGLGLVDICLWFLALTIAGLNLQDITVIMLCFGMGASTQALFARVGGGIYTKAADVGADLVGKVEAGIPEDDPRNPATIADNVGDNVGDVAGMGADLYESYCGSILATAALGVAAGLGMIGVALPMVLAGVGIGASIWGCYLVRTKEGATQRDLLNALGRGVNISSLAIMAATLVLCAIMLGGIDGVVGLHWWGVFISIVAGLLSGIGIGKATEYNTAHEFKPTRGIARQAATGPATVIIEGLAVGMRSTLWPVVFVCAATLVAYGFSGGFVNPALGLFGVGIAAVGMLSTLGITLATDAYGPIADNAGGNAEMSHLEPEVRERTDALDALGNTTAATGKGFAIGSAALTALALLAAYLEEVRVGIYRAGDGWIAHNPGKVQAELKDKPVFFYMGDGLFVRAEKAGGEIVSRTYMDKSGEAVKKLSAVSAVTAGAAFPEAMMEGFIKDGQLKRAKDMKTEMADFVSFYDVQLMNPKVLIGLFLGGMMAVLFCSMTMAAVGRAAGSMVEEVRRQFRAIPGIMEGTATPDYASCVAISTKGAQREMIVPSLMALIVPVAVGAVLGVAGVMGLLAGGLVTGFVVAVLMANAGGAWDNAKKYIESGDLKQKLIAPKELVEAAKAAEGAKLNEEGVLVVVDKGQKDELIAKARMQTSFDTDLSGLLPVVVVRAKKSDFHKAAVVGDTVGDPFKDTSGPSLNILIKLMSMVSVVFAGFTVKYGNALLNALTGK
ncbi:MAG TPA: sodium-translocating pyrophosphatase [Candidatus Brocadiia bacterium]|nr:sodium-translocating pyrophosphatase [Candidatus Brocadiia bacterium]